MKDKEMIEEMANDIQNAVNGCAKYWAEVIAKYLTEQGYRKLLKDNVVLSKEEYENIYEQAEQNVLANIADGGTSCQWCIEQHEKKASKETAEKIFSTLLNCHGHYSKEHAGEYSFNLDKDRRYRFVSKAFIYDLAKQFGVEIKE